MAPPPRNRIDSDTPRPPHDTRQRPASQSEPEGPQRSLCEPTRAATALHLTPAVGDERVFMMGGRGKSRACMQRVSFFSIWSMRAARISIEKSCTSQLTAPHCLAAAGANSHSGLPLWSSIGGFQDVEWPLASAFSSTCGKVLKPNFPAGAPESLAILDVI